MITDAPAIYCGTYAKYNAGSIGGKWLALDDYSDSDSFIEACRELHKDEADPELMFQDFQNFPKDFYAESPDPAKLAALYEWIALDDDDKELLAVYLEHVDQGGDIERAREAFMGKADSEAAWAEQWLDDAGMLAELPKWAEHYIDFEAYARDARIGGDVTFARHEGELWVFSNN